MMNVAICSLGLTFILIEDMMKQLIDWIYYNTIDATYRIVGFFEVLKFRDFRGFDGFVKFKPSKN